MGNLEINIFIVVGIGFCLAIALFIFIFISTYQKRQISHRLERVNMQTEFQQTISQTRIEIQEQTLKTVSQEIHDNIGQALSLIKLYLNTIVAANAESTIKLADCDELLRNAIQDLRDLSKSLNTDAIKEIGLIEALDYELKMINKTGKFSAKLQVEGFVDKINSNTELILFRMIQECLNNTIKHSKARSIIVHAIYQTDSLQLLIKDDGVGFDIAHQNSRGLGLKNLYDRVKFIDASISINSSLGAGTEVCIVVKK